MEKGEKLSVVLGFPGALAKQTATALCERGDRRVVLVARPKDLTAARDWACERPAAEILEGDWSKMDLGVGGARYLGLSREVSEIYCLVPPLCGSDESDLVTARRTRREVVELGLASAGIERMVILSHLDVAGELAGGWSEDDFDLGQDFVAADQKERFGSERVYRRFSDRLPVVFLRPGWVVGQGEGLCPLVHLFLSAPEITTQNNGVGRMLLTDLQSLVDIAAGIPDAVDAGGLHTLHLNSEPPVMAGDLARDILEMARGLVPPGYDLAAGARRVLKRSEGEFKLSCKALMRRQSETARIDSEFTRGLLHDKDLPIPCVDGKILAPLVERAVEEIVGFR